MKKPIPQLPTSPFPSEIISHAVWLCHRFCLSFREAEELLAERGIMVTHETVRQWCQKFGPDYARKLKKRQGRLWDIWHIDEVFVTIQGQRHYLYRAIDQDGDVIDNLAQSRHNQRAAHLHPFSLPGGEQTEREPRRAEVAVRWETFGAQLGGVDEECVWNQQQLLVAMLAKRIHSPITTSMGRLFDAVASMLGLCQVATFEGQAAMALEQEAMKASVSVQGQGEAYPIPLVTTEDGSQRWIADWKPMIKRLADDLRGGVGHARIAYRFHSSLAELIVQVAERVGLRKVVLTGGCFQNALLVDLVVGG